MNETPTPRTDELVARHQRETDSLPDNPSRDTILAHAQRQILELLSLTKNLERELAEAESALALRSAEAGRDAAETRWINEAIWHLGLNEVINVFVTPYGSVGEMLQHVMSKAADLKKAAMEGK